MDNLTASQTQPPSPRSPEAGAERLQGDAPPAHRLVERHPRAVSLLLNVAHGVDHMFLLIFATAVASIAVDFGFANWTDLMPYGVGAFFLFGLGALPAGRLGDLWGRRVMMIIFFAGMGASALLV